jgi:hypothetical protein
MTMLVTKSEQPTRLLFRFCNSHSELLTWFLAICNLVERLLLVPLLVVWAQLPMLRSHKRGSGQKPLDTQ